MENNSSRRPAKAGFKRKERKSQDRRLYAPANGKFKPLSSVSDPMMASKMFGEGIALTMDDDTVVSPCSGTVVMTAYTKQSIGLENEQGDMILLHLGTGLGQYRGRGLELLCSEGSKVRPGAPLLKIDRRFFESQNTDLTLCMTITNQNKGVWRVLEGDQMSAGKTPLMERKQ